MRPAEIIAEHGRCRLLGPADFAWFMERRIPPLFLDQTFSSLTAPIAKDRIALVTPRQFEFERYLKSEEPTATAYIVPSFDSFGDAEDLIAWNRTTLASWRGASAILGHEVIYGWRPDDPVDIAPDPLAWLKACRKDVLIVDETRAAPLLRDHPLRAASVAHGRYLRTLCTAPPPRIIVPAPMRIAA